VGVLLAAAPATAAALFISNTKGESISVIDTTTFEVTATIPLGKGKPNRVVFHPDGKTAWVVYDKSHDLGVVDADAHKLIKRVKIGGNPYNLNFTPDGRHLLVLDWSSDTGNDEIIFYDLQASLEDRKSTRLNSSHRTISYAVFCLKKKKKKKKIQISNSRSPKRPNCLRSLQQSAINATQATQGAAKQDG